MDLTLTAPAREDFFLVEIERFQGPLDLLLHLIRTQDIEIFDIPIAKITDQFLKAIKKLDPSDLDGAGEFLEMAATLIHIKAQMLLPRPMDEEDGDPRAELVRRLLEYEQIREVSSRLRAAEADRSRRHSKGYIPPRPKRALTEVPLETQWDEVFAAALLVEMPVPQEREHRVTTRTVTMEEKSVLILEALKQKTRVEFSHLVAGFRERSHGVMTFLAGLELTRSRILFLRQTRPFAELWMYRRPDDEQGFDGIADAEQGSDPVAEVAERSAEDADPLPEPDPGADA